jgi:hypothetical protein
MRKDLEGGGIENPAALLPAPDARRECLVLAHGFNNHAGEAAAAYFGFRRSQYEQYPELGDRVLEGRFGDGYWPGDADWPGPLDWLDAMVYPVAVLTARHCGAVLAAAIQRLPNVERVDFIAHSLGCRVVLEAAEILRTTGPAIGRICLMAAAVPAEMVEPGGRFDDLLWRLIDAGVKIHVMHSDKDTVLRFAFPPGQALAGEPSLRALGLHGPPVDMIGVGGMVTQAQIVGARHGNYWGHVESKARAQAVREAGTFLRIGETRRTFDERPIGDSRDVGDARDIGTARVVGT